ncbi:MAG TPA: EAL domain-containing protein [Acidimicrobiales bacterium]
MTIEPVSPTLAALRADDGTKASRAAWSDRRVELLLAPGEARMMVGRDGRLHVASAASRSMLGLGPGRESLLDIVVPDDLPAVLELLAGDDGWCRDVVVRTQSGARLAVRLSAIARHGDLWALDVTAHHGSSRSASTVLEVAAALLGAEGSIDEQLQNAIARLGEGFGADRASVFAHDTSRPVAEGWSYRWSRPGVEYPHLDPDWWQRQLGEPAPLQVHRIDDTSVLPNAAEWRERAIASFLAVRSTVGGGFRVGIGLSMKDAARRWTDDDVHVLQLAAAILGNALRRAQAEAALRAQRDALEAAKERLRSTIDAAPAVIYRIDADTRVLLANEEAARFGDLPADQLVGVKLVDFVEPDVAAQMREQVAHAFATGEPVDSLTRIVSTTRGEVWFDCRAVPELGPDGKVESLLLFAVDVTARRAMEEQVRRFAEADPLTGLANRRTMIQRLQRLLARDPAPRSVAVLFIDLDRFKQTNDSLGHTTGDLVLQGVAHKLTTCARDNEIVARLGGDEFAMVLTDLQDLIDLVRRVEHVRRAIAAPIDVGNQTVWVTASIGVALVSEVDRTPTDLLRLADVAMYQAKVRGRDRFEIFDDHLRREVEERIDTEAALRRAVPERQLEVHYQPEVLLDSGKVVGVEALVRWRHPERGLLLPSTFIPLAEETGMIADIGRVVLAEACRQVGAWSRRHPDLPLTLRVNVSGRQLARSTLLQDVTVALAEAGLPAQRLCLEITETALMTDIESSIRMLRAVRELGVSVAVDDFGTGYSSLGYLERFPVDALKIDRSFVAGLGVDAKSDAIVRTLLNLAHVLELDVVAEGVETEHQAAKLRSMGCERGQGFLYAPGLAAPDLERLLARGSVSPGWSTSGR